MSSFKPMVKMYTDEPSVILKLKKGGKVKAKHEEHGHKAMHETKQAHKMHEAMEAEEGHAPKKPSMAERRKAMNPNLYAKGGKVAHKMIGGGMPMAGRGGVNMMPQATGRSGGINPNPMMGGMGPAAIAQMAPAVQAARAAQLRRALTGMKKGGSAEMSEIKKLERELRHHEKLSASRAHGMKHKASGGEIDRDETKTTIEHDEKPFVRTKMVDGQHHDKRHGTGIVKEGKPGGYKRGGKIKHHADGGSEYPEKDVSLWTKAAPSLKDKYRRVNEDSNPNYSEEAVNKPSLRQTVLVERLEKERLQKSIGF